jgi:hypothetical protein
MQIITEAARTFHHFTSFAEFACIGAAQNPSREGKPTQYLCTLLLYLWLSKGIAKLILPLTK